jgi:hypothetical protein
MNIKAYILILALVALCGSSCSDFLNEQNPNRIPAETFYSTEQDITFAATGAYAILRAGGYYGGLFYCTDLRSGSTRVGDPGGSNGTNFEFENYTLKTDNTRLKTIWSDIYKGVTRSNIVLDRIDGIPFADEADKSRIKAEMFFLRALAYFNLVVQWGDVPIVTTELKTLDEIWAHTKRDPKGEVYNLIKSDLSAVISSSLPNLQTGAGIGRASKAAAHALLGKTLLHKAADPDFAAERQVNLTDAKTHLEAAWTMKPFASLSAVNYADVFDKAKQTTCPEILFMVMFQGGNSAVSSNYNYTFQPNGPNNIGLTSRRSGGGVNLPTDNMMNEYELLDPRKDVSVSTANGWNYTKKYTDLDDDNGYGANKWIVLRYADVALLLAEVKMHLGETDAVNYINEVRSRVGLGDAPIANLRDAIVHERKVELAFEGQSWYDLIRLYSREELLTLKSAQNPNFSVKDFLLPVPYDEYKLNPEKMYQNEGYK